MWGDNMFCCNASTLRWNTHFISYLGDGRAISENAYLLFQEGFHAERYEHKNTQLCRTWGHIGQYEVTIYHLLCIIVVWLLPIPLKHVQLKGITIKLICKCIPWSIGTLVCFNTMDKNTTPAYWINVYFASINSVNLNSLTANLLFSFTFPSLCRRAAAEMMQVLHHLGVKTPLPHVKGELGCIIYFTQGISIDPFILPSIHF